MEIYSEVFLVKGAYIRLHWNPNRKISNIVNYFLEKMYKSYLRKAYCSKKKFAPCQ